MDCCLWLNRKKISSAAEIIENFDLASIRGYFLGGSLAEWLREHDGAAYADIIDKIDPSDDMLNEKLARAFGVHADSAPEVFCGKSGEISAQPGGSFAGSFAAGSGMVGSLAGSFYSGGFGFPWNSGSFGSYTGYLGSGGFSGSGSGFGLLGSYRFSLWEWEWEWRFARRGSFSLGSFGSYRFGAGSYFLGSFGAAGSYRFGSGSYFLGNAGSFHGSFGYGSGGVMTADEYDRIMYECLRKCPLNCYGYGIHIV